MAAQPKSAMRTIAKQKASQRYQDAKARRACVLAVWKRAGGCCEACGTRVYSPQDARYYGLGGHVHEKLSRALGGSHTDPENCLLLCVRDHMNAPSGAHRRSARAER